MSQIAFGDVDVTGINRKIRNVLKYPDPESAHRPAAHSAEYLSIQSFLTSVMTILPLLKRIKRIKQRVLVMILYILFTK